MKELIEKSLGRKLEELSFPVTDDLNKVSEELLDLVLKLDHRAHQIYLLKQFVQSHMLTELASFIEGIEDGQDIRTWRRGAIWMKDTSLQQQLEMPVEWLLEDIGQEFEYYHKPDQSYWLQGSSTVGAPARLVPESNYKTKSPDGITSYSMNMGIIEPVGEKDRNVIIRRWIAQRIARCLFKGEPLQYPIKPYMLDEFSRLEDWSEEAIFALQGLNIELKQNLEWESFIPGFSGEDKWYLPS